MKIQNVNLKMQNDNVTCKIISLFSVFCFLCISAVYAEEGVQEVRPNGMVKIDITLNTQGETVNVISGKVLYDEELFDFEMADESKSVVSIWIDKFGRESGVVRYAGMIPGGYVGDSVFIASLLFRAKQEGAGTIATHETRAFRNDGEGTEISLPSSTFVVKVSKDAPEPVEFSLPPDVVPPDPFPVYPTKEAGLFDGKWFIVFLSQDRGSGIDHYEVAERKGVWERAESPHVLRDQTRSSYIYVKAVDRAGNETISELPPVSMFSLRGWYLFGVGVFIVILCGILVWRKKREKII